MNRTTATLLALAALAMAPAAPPILSSMASPQSIDDPDTAPRHAISGDLSYLTSLRGSNDGDSPYGLSLAYGLSGHTELGFGIGALSGGPRYRRDERDAFGDVAFSVKTRFFERSNLALAAAYQTTLLSADRDRNDDRADQSVGLIASETLGKLELVGNLGTTVPGTSVARTVPLYGASALYDLHRGTGLLAQFNENQPQSAALRNKLELGAGITQRVATGLELQALVGKDGRGRRDTGLFLGASYHFGGGD